MKVGDLVMFVGAGRSTWLHQSTPSKEGFGVILSVEDANVDRNYDRAQVRWLNHETLLSDLLWHLPSSLEVVSESR
tara:strand:- start:516 stop:743 length:228 start_codon:yes stop_codon:yes gene_type:complete